MLPCDDSDDAIDDENAEFHRDLQAGQLRLRQLGGESTFITIESNCHYT